MYRECLKVTAIIIALTIVHGCSKAKQKFKVPDIKMITSEYVLSLDAPDEKNIWIVGNYGVIYHSEDEGQNWSEQHSGLGSLLTDVDFVDGKSGWVSGIKGTLLHTSDGGASWSQQKPGTERHILAVSFVDREYGWAVGDFSTILHTKDGGNSWVPQKEEEDRIYSDVCFTDRYCGWIVGEDGIILHTMDGGTTWERNMPEFFKRATMEEEYTNPRPALFGVFFTDRDHGWLCGMDSTIMHTKDGGKAWKVVNNGQDILCNIFIKGGRGWAVGSQGTYLLSRDKGISWEVQKDAVKSKLGFANVFFSTPEKGWIVGASGTVVHTSDGGETWSFFSGLSYEIEWFEMPEALEKRIIE